MHLVFLQKVVFAKSRGLFIFVCSCACSFVTADARDSQRHCDAGLQQVRAVPQRYSDDTAGVPGPLYRGVPRWPPAEHRGPLGVRPHPQPFHVHRLPQKHSGGRPDNDPHASFQNSV